MSRIPTTTAIAAVLLLACVVAAIVFDTNDVKVAGASVSDIAVVLAVVLAVYLFLHFRRARGGRPPAV
jgi:hypothetical protein